MGSVVRSFTPSLNIEGSLEGEDEDVSASPNLPPTVSEPPPAPVQPPVGSNALTWDDDMGLETLHAALQRESEKIDQWPTLDDMEVLSAWHEGQDPDTEDTAPNPPLPTLPFPEPVPPPLPTTSPPKTPPPPPLPPEDSSEDRSALQTTTEDSADVAVMDMEVSDGEDASTGEKEKSVPLDLDESSDATVCRGTSVETEDGQSPHRDLTRPPTPNPSSASCRSSSSRSWSRSRSRSRSASPVWMPDFQQCPSRGRGRNQRRGRSRGRGPGWSRTPWRNRSPVRLVSRMVLKPKHAASSSSSSSSSGGSHSPPLRRGSTSSSTCVSSSGVSHRCNLCANHGREFQYSVAHKFKCKYYCCCCDLCIATILHMTRDHDKVNRFLDDDDAVLAEIYAGVRDGREGTPPGETSYCLYCANHGESVPFCRSHNTGCHMKRKCSCALCLRATIRLRSKAATRMTRLCHDCKKHGEIVKDGAMHSRKCRPRLCEKECCNRELPVPRPRTAGPRPAPAPRQSRWDIPEKDLHSTEPAWRARDPRLAKEMPVKSEAKVGAAPPGPKRTRGSSPSASVRDPRAKREKREECRSALPTKDGPVPGPPQAKAAAKRPPFAKASAGLLVKKTEESTTVNRGLNITKSSTVLPVKNSLPLREISPPAKEKFVTNAHTSGDDSSEKSSKLFDEFEDKFDVKQESEQRLRVSSPFSPEKSVVKTETESDSEASPVLKVSPPGRRIVSKEDLKQKKNDVLQKLKKEQSGAPEKSVVSPTFCKDSPIFPSVAKPPEAPSAPVLSEEEQQRLLKKQIFLIVSDILKKSSQPPCDPEQAEKTSEKVEKTADPVAKVGLVPAEETPSAASDAPCPKGLPPANETKCTTSFTVERPETLELPEAESVAAISKFLQNSGSPRQISVADGPLEDTDLEALLDDYEDEVGSQDAAETPLRTTPTFTPLSGPPPAVKVHAMPAAVPLQAIPAAVPLQAIPAAVPLQAIPAAVPLQAIPAAVPLEAIPAAVPLQAIPAAVPLQAIPAAVPLQGIPAAVPLQGIPAADPLHSTPPAVKKSTMPPATPPRTKTPQAAVHALPPTAPFYQRTGVVLKQQRSQTSHPSSPSNDPRTTTLKSPRAYSKKLSKSVSANKPKLCQLGQEHAEKLVLQMMTPEIPAFRPYVMLCRRCQNHGVSLLELQAGSQHICKYQNCTCNACIKEIDDGVKISVETEGEYTNKSRDQGNNDQAKCCSQRSLDVTSKIDPQRVVFLDSNVVAATEEEFEDGNEEDSLSDRLVIDDVCVKEALTSVPNEVRVDERKELEASKKERAEQNLSGAVSLAAQDEPKEGKESIGKERYCSFCRNHGVLKILRGHKLKCPYRRSCKCPSCIPKSHGVVKSVKPLGQPTKRPRGRPKKTANSSKTHLRTLKPKPSEDLDNMPLKSRLKMMWNLNFKFRKVMPADTLPTVNETRESKMQATLTFQHTNPSEVLIHKSQQETLVILNTDGDLSPKTPTTIVSPVSPSLERNDGVELLQSSRENEDIASPGEVLDLAARKKPLGLSPGLRMQPVSAPEVTALTTSIHYLDAAQVVPMDLSTRQVLRVHPGAYRKNSLTTTPRALGLTPRQIPETTLPVGLPSTCSQPDASSTTVRPLQLVISTPETSFLLAASKPSSSVKEVVQSLPSAESTREEPAAVKSLELSGAPKKSLSDETPATTISTSRSSPQTSASSATAQVLAVKPSGTATVMTQPTVSSSGPGALSYASPYVARPVYLGSGPEVTLPVLADLEEELRIPNVEKLRSRVVSNDNTPQSRMRPPIPVTVWGPPPLSPTTSDHREPRYPCDQCGMVAKSELERVRHRVEQHTAATQYPCVSCDNVTSWSRMQAAIHATRVHPPVAQDQFRCSDCSACFPSDATLRSHLLASRGDGQHRTVHADQPTESPRPLCCTQAKSPQRPVMHVHANENHIDVPEPGRPLAVDSPESLLAHRHRHLQDNAQHRCLVCNQPFVTQELLQMHVAEHHPGPNPYVCPICFLAFYQSCGLDEHVRRSHPGSKPFACREPGCGRAYSCSSQLHEHAVKAEHMTTPAPQDWGLSGVWQPVLQQHLDSATCGSLFPCSGCPAIFPDRWSLQDHQDQAHMGLIPIARVAQLLSLTRDAAFLKSLGGVDQLTTRPCSQTPYSVPVSHSEVPTSRSLSSYSQVPTSF